MTISHVDLTGMTTTSVNTYGLNVANLDLTSKSVQGPRSVAAYVLATSSSVFHPTAVRTETKTPPANGILQKTQELISVVELPVLYTNAINGAETWGMVYASLMLRHPLGFEVALADLGKACQAPLSILQGTVTAGVPDWSILAGLRIGKHPSW